MYDQKYDLYAVMAQRQSAILEKSAGKDNIEYAKSLAAIAEAYTILERDDDAEKLYKESIEISERILGPCHYELAMPLRSLGLIYVRQKRLEQSVEYFERNIAIFGGEPRPLMMPFLLGGMGMLTDLYLKLDRFSEAEVLCERMLAIHATDPEVYGSLTPGVLGQLEKIKRAKTQSK
jgi:tetratricopeptide (TPR) repeat protein